MFKQKYVRYQISFEILVIKPPVIHRKEFIDRLVIACTTPNTLLVSDVKMAAMLRESASDDIPEADAKG